MKYYYLDSTGTPKGPVGLDELNKLYAEGSINETTNVALQGSNAWTRFATLSQQPSTPTKQPMQNSNYKEYKVVFVAEGGCGTILLGAAGIPVKKMEACINQHAAEGWQVVFQVIENKRFLLFWSREAVIITFGR